jgi:hypothetical protein
MPRDVSWRWRPGCVAVVHLILALLLDQAAVLLLAAASARRA